MSGMTSRRARVRVGLVMAGADQAGGV